MSFWPLLIMLVVFFVGLIIALRQILARDVTKATGHLQDLSSAYAERHEELKRRLEESERHYQEQITRAKTESEQLMSQAQQEAETSRVKLLEQARGEGERIVQQALESSDGLRREMEQTMERRAVERACELLREVLPGQLRQEIQTRWLDELIRNGMGQLEQVKTQGEIREARVVSALPLSGAQQDLLRQRLKEKLGRTITVTETVDEALIAGLTISMGSLVLDGSLATKLRRAARKAQTSS